MRTRAIAARRSRGGATLVVLCFGPFGLATAALGAEIRQAFVTSAVGSADFSSWPQVTPGAVGLDAADSICRNVAAAASLARPGAFRAWLSDSLDDAWCRVQDRTGTRDGGCDGAPAPAGAGPWARTGDGARWAGSLSALTDDQGPLVPLDRDEHALAVPALDLHWTGTDETGRAFDALPSSMCADWASSAAASTSVLGSSFETRVGWTLSFGGSCDGHHHLACLEAGAGGGQPPVATAGPAALAFVTSATGNGDLSGWARAAGQAGLAAADAICSAEAAAAHLPQPQSFVAWLSTSSQNARARLPSNIAWRRVDGTAVAASRADLIDGQLAAPVNETAASGFLPRPPAWLAPTWTGTAYDGSWLPGEACGGWDSSSGDATGLGGAANSTAADWTDSRPYSCDLLLPLYCFSSVEILFWGAFESGDAGAWTPGG